MENLDSIQSTLSAQRAFFLSGQCLNIEYRLKALRRLEKALHQNEETLSQALYLDLGKAPSECHMTEYGLIYHELRFFIRKLPSLAKEKRKKTPLSQFCGRSFESPEPYGLALIMSPWNYPLMLSLLPLIGAIAAGNCVLLKLSSDTPNLARELTRILGAVFEPGHVSVYTGGRLLNEALFRERFDIIFFTGSPAVGKLVMAAAAKNLTPVVLELGGKSPVLVTEDADVPLAAKRILFGKLLNAGQTCVAPDYILVDQKIKNRLVQAIQKELPLMLGDKPLQNPDYPKIVNQKQFDRLLSLLQGQKILMGGEYKDLRLAPTLVDEPALDSPLMQEEIFGPILPFLSYPNLEEAFSLIRSFEKPLALYLFCNNQKTINKTLNSLSFGGGCINDTVVQVAIPDLGFGGVGHSGLGAYHGQKSFDAFTHRRSVFKRANWIDINIRYHPYSKLKEKIIRLLMR